MSAKNNETALSTIDMKLVSNYAAEWRESGLKGRNGKPDFSFDMLGLKEGTKLYCTGEKEPIAEIGKRPLLVRTNRVKLYCTGEEYKDLESAERAYKIHNQKPAKSVTGWRFFRAKVSDGKTDAVLTLRALYDLWPDVESALTGALASANAPKAKPASKPATKSTKKLIDENKALQDQLKAMQDQLNKLSSK